MDREPVSPPAPPSAYRQSLARIALTVGLLALGLWILHEFLAGVRARHGSVATFLEHAGVPDGTFAALRDTLLEPDR